MNIMRAKSRSTPERNADSFDAAWKKSNDERDALIKSGPAYDHAYAVAEGTPANARIQIKGNPLKLGPEVPRGFLQLLGGQRLPADEPGSGTAAIGRVAGRRQESAHCPRFGESHLAASLRSRLGANAE
jgi:hypothetical protein